VNGEGWISVNGWRDFQHYDPAKRQPPWIKLYTRLHHDDDFLQLPASQRAILLSIWLETAQSQARLRADTSQLARRFNLRVRQGDLEALVDAGFIRIVASKTLAEGYHDASDRAHVVETETEEEPSQVEDVVRPHFAASGSDSEQETNSTSKESRTPISPPGLPSWEPRPF
jgi:hypothetical protein